MINLEVRDTRVSTFGSCKVKLDLQSYLLGKDVWKETVHFLEVTENPAPRNFVPFFLYCFHLPELVSDLHKPAPI
jgi:hypothetical protein